MDRVERAIPWLLGALLAARCGAALAESPLLQGDLPGHLESIRWSSRHLWPLPWGWDPRYLLGAPVGVLYPPLLSWTGGGLAILVGAEHALRALLVVAIAITPPALAYAARGLGLRAREASLATALATAVLCLPGPGLGGTFRQTLVAGNAANALALPLFLAFVGSLRRGLARPNRWRLPAAVLGAVLLGHFLLGAAAGGILAAYTLGPRGSPIRTRLPRGIGIGVVGLLLAAPFLLPFLRHLAEGSPDGLSYAPFPSPAEWLVLAGSTAAWLVAPRASRRGLGSGLLLVLGFYAFRGAVLPSLGELPFRMEWHRFRLLLYLAAAPAGVLALRRIRLPSPVARAVTVGAALAAALLFLAVPYPGPGPAPISLPSTTPGALGARTLVLASPLSQNGSWHGLQIRLPQQMGVLGTKGLFVESSPFARPIFEIERALSAADARPRWWGIRTDPWEELARIGPDEAGGRLAALGIDSVVAREPVAPLLETLAPERSSLGNGFWLFPLPDRTRPDSVPWRELVPLADSPVPARADGPVRIASLPSGSRIEVDFGEGSEGFCLLHVFAHGDWRVESGEGRIERLPAGPGAGPRALLLGVRGRGRVVVRFAPRIEEWGGLVLGAVGAGILFVSFRRRGGRR